MEERPPTTSEHGFGHPIKIETNGTRIEANRTMILRDGLVDTIQLDPNAVILEIAPPRPRAKPRSCQRFRDGTVENTGPRVGRNDPCPCRSGKKFKKCCLTRK